tara:strand:+ start:40 stop:357 length:318 start_codon:yes stop_codon:yes gene_type:complete
MFINLNKHKMSKKSLFIITALILSSSTIFVQKDLDQSTDEISNLFETAWSLGVNYVITLFDGVIRKCDYSSAVQTSFLYQDSDFKELRSAFSISLKKLIIIFQSV